MTDETQIRLMAWWYKKIIDFTKILDLMNKTNQPVFTAVNEGIRRMAKESIGYISEITDTQEMPAVTDDDTREFPVQVFPVGNVLPAVDLGEAS
jgi:hypothetical protein